MIKQPNSACLNKEEGHEWFQTELKYCTQIWPSATAIVILFVSTLKRLHLISGWDMIDYLDLKLWVRTTMRM